MFTIKNIKYTPGKPPKVDPSIPQWMIPSLYDDELKFTIINSNSAFANAIRIASMDEIPIKVLGFNYDNLITGDKFIIREVVQEAINLLPIKQDIDLDTEFILDVANGTGLPLHVHSGDIKPLKGKGDYFDKNQKLFTLSEGSGIKITGIKPKTGYGKDHTMYNIVGGIRYKTLNQSMDVMTTEYKDFEFVYNLNSTIPPHKFITMIIESLDSYMDLILEDLPQGGKMLSILRSDNGAEYKLHDGFYMVGNILKQYMLKVDKNIPSVTLNITNYETRDIGVNVVHKETDNKDKLLRQAIALYKKDLYKFRDTFLKTKL